MGPGLQPVILDTSGQPTPRADADTVREVLQGQLAQLKALPLDLMAHASNAEHVRSDAFAIAIEHLQAAIDALEVAGRE